MLSHSRTPNETDLSLSLSLSFEIVYSFVSFLVVSFLVVARNTFPPTREKRVERLKIIFMTMFFVHFTKQAFRSKFASFTKKNKREQKEGGRDEGCDEDDDVRGDEAESDDDESTDFEDDDDDTDDWKIFFLF
jgi:hypothetical protein